MGAGASVVDPAAGATAAEPMKQCVLKKLPDAIEDSLYQEEKFPLLIDPTEQASRFLKYQLGSYIRYDDPVQCTPEYLNRALVGALRYGRTLTIKCNSLRDVDRNKLFANPRLFPEAVLCRTELCKEEVWSGLLTDDDPDASEFSLSPEFVFTICTTDEYIPPEMQGLMCVIKVFDGKLPLPGESAGGGEVGDGDDAENENAEANGMEGIAAMFGGKEIIRNSEELVEAAFDGDMEEMVSWIEKGFHLESSDGRKHTALSEAACQGHVHIVEYLLAEGADPNVRSDTGRSAIWRAAFGGHVEVIKTLLEAGADPSYRDKVSMESAFDVAQNEEIKELLTAWPLEKTESLKAARKRAVIAKIEERIKTSADREFYARQKIRNEIVEKANDGDVDGVFAILHMVAEEAEKSQERPRVNAEARNDQGLSLLAIAARNDDVVLAERLITHWQECDKDRWDLNEGELSTEAKTFKTNVNARDLKGWNVACIAVFHYSLKVLQLLCEHGAQLSMRSMYNRNAYDLAKDELDAAENVMVDKSAIRAVIEQYDQYGVKKNVLYGTSSGGDGADAAGAGGEVTNGEIIKLDKAAYEGVGTEGSPVLMQLEVNKSKQIKAKEGGGKGGTVKAAAGKKSAKKK